MIRRLATSLAVGAAAVAIGGAGTARAQSCAAPPYPGDAAPREAIAQWMAYGAGTAGLPRELPVMGALVESGLRNLPSGETDSAGFFQMRTSIWNTGAYAGFPQRPELQLQWFVDQATSVREARIGSGAPDPATNESDWGAWIADVLRPAENLRGSYQPRLAEARALVGAPCVPETPAPGDGAAAAPAGSAPPATLPPGSPAPAVRPTASAPLARTDRLAPVVRLSADRRQRALRRGAIIVAVACPAESCVASATAVLRLPGARRALRLSARPRVVGAARRTLRLALAGRARARVRAALRSRRSLRAAVRVAAVDAAGNRTVRARTILLTG